MDELAQQLSSSQKCLLPSFVNGFWTARGNGSTVPWSICSAMAVAPYPIPAVGRYKGSAEPVLLSEIITMLGRIGRNFSTRLFYVRVRLVYE